MGALQALMPSSGGKTFSYNDIDIQERGASSSANYQHPDPSSKRTEKVRAPIAGESSHGARSALTSLRSISWR